ncbi:IS4 family transposase [Streptomyces sp. 846.5]|nr:IS4 family transposase [Streptomyces sp. 846.5]TDT95565.1 IS4 family transposase [Streptomyces sp. 846.5]
MDLEAGAGVGRRAADEMAVGVLTRTFPADLVDLVIDLSGRREKRTRKLPARFMFYFVLALCLFPQESYRSTMKILMGAFGRSAEDQRVPTAAAIGYARRRLGSDAVEAIVREVIRPVADKETQGAWYRDWRLVAFDGSVFTVPDTEENDREFGRPGSGRGDGRGAYPQVQTACLVELGTHAVFDARIDRYSTSETVLIEEMFGSLQPGMLALADRGIYGFHKWILAAETGADLLWRVASNLILRPIEYLADGSYIAEVIPPKKSGATSFQLRVIEYKLPQTKNGKDELYRLVTTIMDPVKAPAKELAIIYHERWDVEGFLKQIKGIQLNDERILRSKSPDGVRQEFWAHLAVHYATVHIMMDAARAAGLDPDRISHKETVRIIRSRIWRPESFPPRSP